MEFFGYPSSEGLMWPPVGRALKDIGDIGVFTYFVADLLFDMFGFDHTSKLVDNFSVTKLLNSKQEVSCTKNSPYKVRSIL